MFTAKQGTLFATRRIHLNRGANAKSLFFISGLGGLASLELMLLGCAIVLYIKRCTDCFFYIGTAIYLTALRDQESLSVPCVLQNMVLIV